LWSVLRQTEVDGEVKQTFTLPASCDPRVALGPKKIKAVHDELGIDTVEKLEPACKDGEIAGLKGFGEKRDENTMRIRRQCASIARASRW
jgi:hypothetical protein